MVNVDHRSLAFPNTMARIVAVNQQLANDLQALPFGGMQMRNRVIQFNPALATEVLMWLTNMPAANQAAFDHFSRSSTTTRTGCPFKGSAT
jgi:hypothetical protein